MTPGPLGGLVGQQTDLESEIDVVAPVRQPQLFVNRLLVGVDGLGADEQLVAVVVPCHRVVMSDGSIGGYSGLPGVKKALLAAEGALASSQTG